MLCYRFLYLNLLLFLYAYLSFAYGCYRKYVVFVINYDVLVYSGNLLCMFIFGAYMHVKYIICDETNHYRQQMQFQTEVHKTHDVQLELDNYDTGLSGCYCDMELQWYCVLYR